MQWRKKTSSKYKRHPYVYLVAYHQNITGDIRTVLSENSIERPSLDLADIDSSNSHFQRCAKGKMVIFSGMDKAAGGNWNFKGILEVQGPNVIAIFGWGRLNAKYNILNLFLNYLYCIV